MGSTAEPPAARRWVAEGRVQGVGFRWFVVQQARALGLAGWVANRDDGGVEAEAKGPRDRLDQLEAVIRTGPPGSRVTRLTPCDVPHESVDANSFSVKH